VAKDSLACPQHGELRDQSTENVRVDDRVKARSTERELSRGSHDCRDAAGKAVLPPAHGLSESLDGKVCEHRSASSQLREVQSGPAPARTKIQQPTSRRKLQLDWQRSGLRRCGVAIAAEIPPKDQPLSFSLDPRERLPVLAGEVLPGFTVISAEWHPVH